MILQQFKLTNYKNYDFQSIDCHSKWNCYVGQNGMGKTNLLDAIYYLAMGKSYISSNDQYALKEKEAFFRLEGKFLSEEKNETIVAKVIPRKSKVLERNKVPYDRLAQHVGLIKIVFIAPDDVEIVREGSEIRRRFVDNTCSQLDPAYLKALIEYNKILKQRNALLKQFAENHTFNHDLLRIYNQQMEAPALLLHKVRKTFVASFRPLLQEVVNQLSGGYEQVDCQYKCSISPDSLLEQWIASEEKDRILQRTCLGPHKDDFVFTINEKPLKRYASQGQLKTFVLALKLAQYNLLKGKKNQSPILLLDDIFDKLDESRVQHLLEYIKNNEFGQVFITDTHENRITGILEKQGEDFMKYIIKEGEAMG